MERTTLAIRHLPRPTTYEAAELFLEQVGLISVSVVRILARWGNWTGGVRPRRVTLRRLRLALWRGATRAWNEANESHGSFRGDVEDGVDTDSS